MGALSSEALGGVPRSDVARDKEVIKDILNNSDACERNLEGVVGRQEYFRSARISLVKVA